MHSSLAVTADGLPLGLTAIKFWSRKKFKGANALKKRINPTRVPIEEKESIRWLDNLRQSTTLLGDAARCVHIGDRESDIYELFCTAQDAGTQFLLRTCVDRLAGDGEHTIAAEMGAVDCKGLHRIEVRDRVGNISEATLELKFKTHSGVATHWQEEPLPGACVDGPACNRARETQRSRSDRLEINHQSPRYFAIAGYREASVVRAALEDRSVS